MESLAEVLEKTFADGVFSKSEKRAVKAILREEAPDKHERAWLRSRIFDFAKTHLATHAPEQLLDWLENANKLLLDPTTPVAHTRSYFSPGEDILDAICAQLRGARQRLDICVFTISDDRISNTIIEAHERRVNVRVITDDDKQFDKGSDIHKLEQAGVAVRTDRTRHHMHHKFFIVDAETLGTGSYNWTRSAETSNQENLLLTEEAGAIKSFQREFDRLWKKFG